MIFRKDAFGNLLILKRLLVIAVGIYTFPVMNWLNKTKIRGTENLKGLPKKKVLFVSNHQTYFMDVIAFYHTFSSARAGFPNSIRNPWFLINPVLRLYYIAAEETMKSGIMPRLLKIAGCVSIKRTWREAGKDVNKMVNLKDISNIGVALDDGWVITFPQGTTTPFVKGRRGTTHLIKKFKPIVVPIVIDGFRRTFEKKGMGMKSRGNTLSINIKPPLRIDYDADSDEILRIIMDGIEQSEKYQNLEKKHK